MNEVLVLILVGVLTAAGYVAGRLHGQLSHRLGYRLGYRQGYFDGDRASWNRRRRDLQAAVASVLTTAPEQRADAFRPRIRSGTTYTSTAINASAEAGDDQLRPAGALVKAGGESQATP